MILMRFSLNSHSFSMKPVVLPTAGYLVAALFLFHAVLGEAQKVKLASS